MNFKYELPRTWVDVVSNMEEFANGGTQVTIRLKDGSEISNVLISNAMYIVAARGHEDLPFRLDDIAEIFQTAGDKSPATRGGWHYWDKWEVPSK